MKRLPLCLEGAHRARGVVTTLVALMLLTRSPLAFADAPLTLEAAIRAALDRNPDIDEASIAVMQSEVTAARNRLDRLSAGLTLSVGDNAGITWRPSARRDALYGEGAEGPGLFDNALNYSASSSLSLPILTGGERTARIALGDLDVQSTKIDRDLARRTLIRAVYQAFLTLQGGSLQVAAAEESISLSRQGLEVIQARQANGLAAPLEFNRFQVDLLNQEQRLQELQLQTYLSQQTLIRLLHLEGESLGLDSTPLDPANGVATADTEAWVTRALDHRPELLTLRLALDKTEQERRIARAALRPRLAVNFTAEVGTASQWTADTFESALLLPEAALGAGLQMDWSLFNFGKTRDQVRLVDLTRQRLELQRRSLEAQIAEQVKASLQQLRVLRTRQAGVQRQLDLARENMNIIQNLYAQGSAAILDVFDARSAYRTALTQEANHRINLALAGYELRWVVGEDLSGNGPG